MRINAHGHLLPNPAEIPKSLREERLFWVTDDKKYMCQHDWKRPITDPSFFLEEKLVWMEKNNIDHEVILTLSQLYANGLKINQAIDVCRFQNDFHYRIQKENSDKFTCGFVLPLAFVDDALIEMERAVNQLGLKVFCLPTHYQDQDQKWHSTTSEKLAPIWELANVYNLAVEIHPYDALKMISLEDKFWRFHLVWMCAQTADHYHFYTLMNFPTQYPDIRICYAHGNQFGQMNIGRRKQGFNGRPDLFQNAVSPDVVQGHPNIFVDSIVHDVLSFEMLVRRIGQSQIVAGLDDPYPLGEMESVPDSYPGKVIDEAYSHSIITKEEHGAIWHENVLRWLGG